MIILSLFDGISCGQIALERAGIKVDKYYSSEIDKYAIQITQKNYPNTIQLGDINNWQQWNIEQPDIIMGGSPCQGFSIAGKQLNFEDHRSKLFFKFVDILNHYKPKYFLLENVKMKKEHENIISDYLGVEPILINSALVSAQNRKRLYWTNIPNITQPEDKGVLLKDIIFENNFTFSHIDETFYKNRPNREYKEKPPTIRSGRNGLDVVFEELKVSLNENQQNKFEKINPSCDKMGCLTEATVGRGDSSQEYLSMLKKVQMAGKEKLEELKVPIDKSFVLLDKEVERGKVGYFRKDSQANRVYYIHDKAVTLCGDAGGGAAKMGQYLFGCLTPERTEQRQAGQRFSSGEKFYTLTAQDQHGILTEGYIRKLHPIECERLQTVPDNYTEGVPNTQRYKLLGNGWTVDVIVHILKRIV